MLLRRRSPSRARLAAALPITGARFAERLPFPELGRAFGEVAGEGIERNGERAALAGRAQAGVDFVQPAERAELVAHADQPLAELAEEVAVARADASPLGVGCSATIAAAAARGVAARFVQEDQVEIAVVVRLAAAELAEGEHDRLAGRRLRGPANRYQYRATDFVRAAPPRWAGQSSGRRTFRRASRTRARRFA